MSASTFGYKNVAYRMVFHKNVGLLLVSSLQSFAVGATCLK